MDANCTSKRRKVKSMETVYIAGGCLWGVQHFFDTVPGVRTTEAGRANGTTNTLDGSYDGYAECVKVVFDEKCTSVTELMEHLFEIIDPYSLNKQGVLEKSIARGFTAQIPDIWKKQEPLLTAGRTGIKSLWKCCR